MSIGLAGPQYVVIVPQPLAQVLYMFHMLGRQANMQFAVRARLNRPK